MWNADLVACARRYQTGVLTVVDSSGYPASVRCAVEFDAAAELIRFLAPPPLTAGWQGKVCLLFHRHQEDFGGQHEMLIKGDLSQEEGGLAMKPATFLTGSSSLKSDKMPVSGSIWERFQFMRLGQRKAREYLAKRGGQPWPPRPWKKMLAYLEE